MKSIFKDLERDLIECARREAEQTAPNRSVRRDSWNSGVVRAVPAGVLVAALLGVVIFFVTSFHGGASRSGTALSAGSMPAERLADGYVYCDYGTSKKDFNNGSAAVGQSPTAYCRQTYIADRLTSREGINPASGALVTCDRSATIVDVLIADGQPNQCQRVGDKSLPAGYRAAVTRLGQLVDQLNALERNRGCKTPLTMAEETRAILTNLGLDNWKVKLPSAAFVNSPAGTGAGACGSLIFDPEANGEHGPVQLPADHPSVQLFAGPSYKLASFYYNTSARLYQQTYRRCYTTRSIRTLIAQAYKPVGAQLRYATRAVQKGLRFEPSSERLYERGCVRSDAEYPANNNNYIDVLLLQRGAKPLQPDHPYPPASAFRP